MPHLAFPLGLLLILSLSETSLIEGRPVELVHSRGHNTNPGRPSHRHATLYIQINNEGQVSKTRHQNDNTLMDIEFTNTGILIKGRKSARYLCSDTNNTLYSTFQLMENCKFKEGGATDPSSNNGNTGRGNSSPTELDSGCPQSGQINPGRADPLGLTEC